MIKDGFEVQKTGLKSLQKESDLKLISNDLFSERTIYSHNQFRIVAPKTGLPCLERGKMTSKRTILDLSDFRNNNLWEP